MFLQMLVKLGLFVCASVSGIIFAACPDVQPEDRTMANIVIQLMAGGIDEDAAWAMAGVPALLQRFIVLPDPADEGAVGRILDRAAATPINDVFDRADAEIVDLQLRDRLYNIFILKAHQRRFGPPFERVILPAGAAIGMGVCGAKNFISRALRSLRHEPVGLIIIAEIACSAAGLHGYCAPEVAYAAAALLSMCCMIVVIVRQI
jgi:hypothetical protein